jgi:hypothetical protein
LFDCLLVIMPMRRRDNREQKPFQHDDALPKKAAPAGGDSSGGLQ